VIAQAKEKKEDDEVTKLKSKIKELQQEIRAERRQKNELKEKYDTLVETFIAIESSLTRVKDFMPPTFAAPPLPPMSENPSIEVSAAHDDGVIESPSGSASHAE